MATAANSRNNCRGTLEGEIPTSCFLLEVRDICETLWTHTARSEREDVIAWFRRCRRRQNLQTSLCGVNPARFPTKFDEIAPEDLWAIRSQRKGNAIGGWSGLERWPERAPI